MTLEVNVISCLKNVYSSKILIFMNCPHCSMQDLHSKALCYAISGFLIIDMSSYVKVGLGDSPWWTPPGNFTLVVFPQRFPPRDFPPVISPRPWEPPTTNEEISFRHAAGPSVIPSTLHYRRFIVCWLQSLMTTLTLILTLQDPHNT